MSSLIRSLCLVAAAGRTSAAMAASFQVTRAIDARLDRLSCQTEARAALISADHCATR